MLKSSSILQKAKFDWRSNSSHCSKCSYSLKTWKPWLSIPTKFIYWNRYQTYNLHYTLTHLIKVYRINSVNWSWNSLRVREALRCWRGWQLVCLIINCEVDLVVCKIDVWFCNGLQNHSGFSSVVRSGDVHQGWWNSVIICTVFALFYFLRLLKLWWYLS